MKKVILMLIIAMMLLALIGCAPSITEGEVYAKEYREAHARVSVFPIVISSGKTTTTTMVPYVITYPERFVIFIKAYQEGEWKTEDFYVSEETYDSVNIGDMFLYDKNRGDLQDEPYTKKRKTDEKGGAEK